MNESKKIANIINHYIKDKDLKLIKSFKDKHFFRDVYLIRNNIKIHDLKFVDREVVDAQYVSIKEFEKMLNENQINEWNRDFVETYTNI